MTKRGVSVRRLSPRAVFELINAANAASSATISQTTVQAARFSGRSGARRLVGVAMNFHRRQLSLEHGHRLRHVFFDDVLFGIRARADAGDLDLLLITEMSQQATEKPTHYGEICRRHGADGIIAVAFEPHEPELAELIESELACIAIDTQLIGARASFVTSDNVGGAAAAVYHLGEGGRTRIAYLGGVAETVASADRRLGYESALEELGLEHRDELVRDTDWLPENAYERTTEMLALREPPDAIFCVSDEVAVGAMAAIKDAGLDIPGDVAVASFDDSELARMITPSLTSVRQDRIGLGAAAVEAVLRSLEDPSGSLPASVLPVKLIVRESSAGSAAASTSIRPSGVGTVELERRQEPESLSHLSVADAYSLLGRHEEPPPWRGAPGRRSRARRA